MSFSADETRRYARHIVLRGVGGIGQQKLKAARVLVVGAGGLGSPVIAYLAGAGVGVIRIADADTVSLSNLQRQVIHTTQGIGTPKAESAAAYARALNPEISVVAENRRLTAGNASALMDDSDLIIDGTDNFPSRAAIAAAAESAQKPLVSGAVSMFDGQVTVLAPHLQRPDGTPNPGFRDLYPHDPDEDMLPSCEQAGVLGPVTGVIGTLMAMEAIKIITGAGVPLIGRLLLYDGRAARFTELSYARRRV